MIESLTEFYQRIKINAKASQNAYQKGGEYFDIQPSVCNLGKTSFSYRDFYKVALVLQTGKLYYADKWILVDRPAILFSTPLIPYAWESTGEGNYGTGHFCVFNDAFLKKSDRNNPLADTPLLNTSKERIYFPDDEALGNIRFIFNKIQQEMTSGYVQKSDVLRCYLHLLVHEAMKLQSAGAYEPQRNAGQRTAELFLALLDRQFPIDLPHKTLDLKTANDYAERLSVHVNHLNRVVKSATGRTTSTLITSRIVQESIQLLQHSNHSVGEIAFALGFEEPASFSNFIKKHTDLSPTAHRCQPSV